MVSKEFYLNEKNQAKKISSWLNECRKFKQQRDFKLDLKKSALLILDMQNFFLEEPSHAFVPSATTIIPPINQLIERIQKYNGEVIFTRHLTSDNPEDPMKRWWKDTISITEPKSEINPFLNQEKGEVFTKSQYNAFEGTYLEEWLRERNCNQIIITGVLTHLCCETTARLAFMKGFDVFFVVDATATYTEELHVGTLRAISHGFGICLSSKEIVM